MPENTQATNFLEADGTFHVVADVVNPYPQKEATGEAVNAVYVHVTVLGGNPAGWQGKKATLKMWNPHDQQKDGGEFCSRVQYRMCRALGLLPQQPLAPGQVYNPPWEQGAGRQFIVRVKMENGYPNIDGSHIYAIGDPEVASVPLDRNALAAAGIAAPAQQQQPVQTPEQAQQQIAQQQQAPVAQQAPQGFVDVNNQYPQQAAQPQQAAPVQQQAAPVQQQPMQQQPMQQPPVQQQPAQAAPLQQAAPVQQPVQQQPPVQQAPVQQQPVAQQPAQQVQQQLPGQSATGSDPRLADL